MVDGHTHFIPPDVITWLKDNQRAVNAKWEKRSPAKAEFLVVNETWAFELKELFTNTALYLQAQAKAGVSHSLVSPVPQLFLYDFPADITCALASVYNDALARWVQGGQTRLSALATVPLNHPERAAAALRDGMHSGLKGAIVGPGCSGHMLTSDFFAPFWEEADTLGAILFIHPLLNDDPRLKKNRMPNLIGVPWETTICATDLLLSGFLDRYANVKILLAHGGGFLPYQIGRLNTGFEKWHVASEALKAPPQHYLKQFWYDSVLWNSDSLAFLVKLVGEDRVVPGSDFPFDLCAWPPQMTHPAARPYVRRHRILVLQWLLSFVPSMLYPRHK